MKDCNVRIKMTAAASFVTKFSPTIPHKVGFFLKRVFAPLFIFNDVLFFCNFVTKD